MKTPSIRDLQPNELATAYFLVQSKEVRQKRTGEPYLSLILADRTGEIDAKMWDNVAEVMDTFDKDDFVKVKALMQLYNNRPQLTLHKLRRAQDHEIDFSDFFAASLRDPEEMWQELRAMISGLDNQHIRALLDSFLDDPEIGPRFKIAPAAKTIHHAFRSGLLEHVLSLANLAKRVVPHYEVHYNLDFNLVLAGVILHDIGKIHELTYDRGFGYSTEGQLIGHIPIAFRMLNDKLREFPGFPGEFRSMLEHMILSHHGQLDFGSPKVPMFPEALLLHYLDDLDSKMEAMRALSEQDPQAEGLFTRYSPSLERVVLRKSRFLNGPAAASSPVSSTAKSTSDDHWDATPAVPAKPTPKPSPASNSLFAERLKLAISDERK